MRNMGLTGDQAETVMSQWNVGIKDFGLNIGNLTSGAGRLSEEMAHWGYKGGEGSAHMVALLGTLATVTREPEVALSRVMASLSNPAFAEKLGRTPEGIVREIQTAVKNGDTALSAYMKIVREAERKGTLIENIFGGTGPMSPARRSSSLLWPATQSRLSGACPSRQTAVAPGSSLFMPLPYRVPSCL